jgi:hypothetical protein
LDLISIALAPLKADPILIVDPNAILTFPAASQRLEPISRQYAKVFEFRSGVQHSQFLKSLPGARLKTLASSG